MTKSAPAREIRMVWLPRNLPEPGRSSLSGPVMLTAASGAVPAGFLKPAGSHGHAHPKGARPNAIPASPPTQKRSSKPRNHHPVPVSGPLLNPGGQGGRESRPQGEVAPSNSALDHSHRE